MKKFLWNLFWRYYPGLKPLGIALLLTGVGITLAGYPLYLTVFQISGGLICLMFYIVARLDEEAAKQLKNCREKISVDPRLPFFYSGMQN